MLNENIQGDGTVKTDELKRLNNKILLGLSDSERDESRSGS